MRITNDEAKPSLEEALEHYGVKGMRWGVRRTPEQLGRARKTVRKINKKLDKRDEKITKARKSVEKTKEEVSLARSVHYRTRIKKGLSEAARQSKTELKQAKMEHLRNPDRVTAAKLKSGEILVDTLFLGGLTSRSIGQQQAIQRQQEKLAKKAKIKERQARING